jgi:4-hydroxy-tetrahydrodipicolinate reductase
VAVDFTHPGVALDHVRFCLDHGIAAVVGTSGFDEAKLATVRGWLEATPGTCSSPRTSVSAPCS